MSMRPGLAYVLVGLALGLAWAVAQDESRRRARARDERRQMQDWESEGGALATQPQVPGT